MGCFRGGVRFKGWQRTEEMGEPGLGGLVTGYLQVGDEGWIRYGRPGEPIIQAGAFSMQEVDGLFERSACMARMCVWVGDVPCREGNAGSGGIEVGENRCHRRITMGGNHAKGGQDVAGRCLGGAGFPPFFDKGIVRGGDAAVVRIDCNGAEGDHGSWRVQETMAARQRNG